MHLSSEGVVLRDLSRDEDRILTLLTREQGVLTAFANQARRLRSSLASSTELLCYSHFQLFQSRERSVVDKADSIHSFFALRSRMEDLALACYLAQLMQELAPRGEPAGDYIDLLLAALYRLEKGKHAHNLLKPAFELRLLTLAGYMPDLVACSVCAADTPGEMLFSLEGNLFCRNCRPPILSGIHPVSDGVLAAMRHAVYAPPGRVFSFSLSPEGLAALVRLCEAYVLHQVEKTFPALEFYRTVGA